MKRRFLLLDHSIEDPTGHYLEYAIRVLRAAKLAGFETILGVNKRAGEIVCPEADAIDKAFSRTFWENQAPNYGELAFGLFRNDGPIAGDSNFSFLYANELRAFFLRAGATADDLVFVPTLGGTELVGIALYSGFEDAQDIKWHLLFRRDLPTPRSLVDARAHLSLRRIRAEFAEVGKRFKKGNIFFYTDTDELTARYNKLGFGSFTTLPIPIDETLNIKKQKHQPPFVVSYLGDARQEKGFHLLPELISTLRSAGFGEQRVRFRIQANLPLCGGTSSAVRAKAELTGYRHTGVEIIEGPFDSDIYHQIILTSDVILIPYCRRSYAARSSGIFAEALAAGVPTIYPEGSWMAKSQLGGGSLGYKNVGEIPSTLAWVLSNYTEFESRSIAHTHDWRNKHSAKRLVRCLADREFGFSEPHKTNNEIYENSADCN